MYIILFNNIANEFIFFYIIIFYITYLMITKVYTYLQLLINFEFIWIILYILCIIVSFFYDDITLLGFCFFLLIFSAIELSIGFILLTIQQYLYKNIIFRSQRYKSLLKVKYYYAWYNLN